MTDEGKSRDKLLEEVVELRRQVQELLRRGEERYRLLLESLSDGVFVLDREWRFTVANEAVAKLLRRPKTTLLGARIVDLFPGAEATTFFKTYERVMATGAAETVVEEFAHPDGRTRWYEVRVYPVQEGILCIASDITDRQRMEKLLRIGHDLAVALSAAPGLGEGLPVCLDAALEASGMDCGGIYIVDQTTGAVELVHHVGLSPDFVSEVSRYDAGSANVQLVMAGEPIYTQQLKVDVPLTEDERRESLRAMAIIPVRHEGRVIACLNVASHEHDEVPLNSREALETIAAQIGSAIARLRVEDALRESEQKYRELADNIPDVFFAMDSELRYTYWNKPSEEITGVLAKDALAKSIYDIFPGIRGTEAEALYLRVVRTGRPGTVEAEYEIGNRQHVFDLSAFPSAKGVAVLCKDITDRKRAEEALRRKVAELDSFLNNIPDMAWLKDRESNFIAANKAFGDAVGMDPAYLISHTCAVCFGEEAAARFKEDDARVMASGHQVRIEESITDARGKTVHLETIKSPILDDERRVVGTVGIARDISERKRAEQALEKERDRAQMLLDVAGTMILALDAEGKVTLVNRRGCEILGCEEREILGKDWFSNFLPEAQREEVRGVFGKLMRGEMEGVDYYENQVVTAAGELRDVGWHNVFLRDDEGRIIGTLGSAVDVTDRKRAEEELSAYRERLRSLASELSLAEERERHRIAAGLHDHVTQDLIAVKSRLEDCPRRKTGPGCAECADRAQALIQNSISELRDMTFALGSPILYELGLVAALDETVKETQEKHGIRSEFEDDGKAKLLGPDLGALVFRAVRELLVNVVKHAKADRLTVSATRDGEGLKVVVEDDGIGFDVAAAASATGNATKFGLFGIRERLDYVGGELRLESEPGRGTRATLVIPLQEEEQEADAEGGK